MLSYEKYNNKKIAVYGDKKIYNNILKNLGARWNSKLKDGPGWVLCIKNENKIKEIINSIEIKNCNFKLNKDMESYKEIEMESDKESYSGLEIESDKESLELDKESLELDKESLESDKESLESDKESLESDKESLESDKESLESDKEKNCTLDYYKSFSIKPYKFKKINDDLDYLDSSSEEDDESEEDYPYPHTKKTYDYIQKLKNTINILKIKNKNIK